MTDIIDINHDTSTNLTHATNYTSSSGADISITTAAALAGTTNGLAILCDDTTNDYARKILGADDTSGILRARFHFDPNALAMATADSFKLFTLMNSAWNGIADVLVYKHATSGMGLIGGYWNDVPAWVPLTTKYITDIEHYIELYVVRSSGVAANDGTFQMWVDSFSAGTGATIDNYDRFNNFHALDVGAASGIDAGTTGTFYVDEIVVNNDGGAIGPHLLTALAVNVAGDNSAYYHYGVKVKG